MAQSAHSVVTQTFAYDGGRQVTAYVTPSPPEAIVFVADGGWHAARLVAALGSAAASTMIVGVNGMPTDEGRLKEYIEAIDPDRFAKHEAFFVDDVCAWVRSSLGIALPPARTAIWGASLGAELALAMGVRHPNVYGIVFSASPGAGYRPPTLLPSTLPRAYLVAGMQEPFFLQNATRWADALRNAKADVVMVERAGTHGGDFWYEEFPLMTRWAFQG